MSSPSSRPAPRVHMQIAARYQGKVKSSRLRQAAQATLDHQRVKRRVELTIMITGNTQLRALNLAFRDVDAPTDVLSFATDEHPRPDTLYLGDVIISYPKAKEQARAGGHSVEAELQLLTVHGVLHLLGHDHDTVSRKNKMWQAQTAVLKKINADITAPKS